VREALNWREPLRNERKSAPGFAIRPGTRLARRRPVLDAGNWRRVGEGARQAKSGAAREHPDYESHRD
jgi:hypothetical protein